MKFFAHKSWPIRGGLDYYRRWESSDFGLIAAWEAGREFSEANPDLVKRALDGELIPLPFDGGLTKKLEGKKIGSLHYLAMWHGMRGEDLDIDTSKKYQIACSKHATTVEFKSYIKKFTPKQFSLV